LQVDSEKDSGVKAKTSGANTNAFLRDDNTNSPTGDSGQRGDNVVLAKRYGVNCRTIAKWQAREGTSDERMGPKNPSSRLLSLHDEAIILASRWRTHLALDDSHLRFRHLMPKLAPEIGSADVEVR
jgi:hypothetical protein